MITEFTSIKVEATIAVMAYIGYIGITLTDVSEYVKIFSGCAVGGFAIYQWVKSIRQDIQKKKK